MRSTTSVRRRIATLLTISATVIGSLFMVAGPSFAVDACTGASEIQDWGAFYVVKGTKGDDWIDCSASDKPVDLRGGAGNDTLYGSTYADTIRGGWGNDSLYGNTGDDWLHGGHGDDYMDGEGDYDNCLGGRGFDWFGGGSVGCDVADYGREP